MFKSLPFSFRLRRVVHKNLCLALLVFSLLLSAQSKARVDQALAQQPATGAQKAQEVTTLEPGKALERELAGGQEHTYQLTLTEGQFAELTVLERGIEVMVTVIAPNGKQVIKLDNPDSTGGPQLFNILAETSGNYRLRVQPSAPNAPVGRYELKVKELRIATAVDRNRAETLRLELESKNLFAAGKYDEALAAAEKALVILEKIHGEGHVETADMLNEIGLIYEKKGEHKKAEQFHLRALRIDEQAFGAEHPYVAAVLNNLGAVYGAMNDFEKAEAAYQRALTIHEKKLGPEHLEVATLLGNLAFLYYSKGEYTKAEQPYQRALSIHEKQSGADSLDVAFVLNNLALLYRVKGDYPKAVLFFERTATIFEKNLPAEHPNIAIALANLAAVTGEMGDYNRAEQLFRRVLTITEKRLGAEHLEVATIVNNFGQLYDTMGDYEKAESFFQRAQAIREKVYSADHPLVAATLNSLASLYRAKGDYAKAEPLFQRALEITQNRLGKEHFNVGNILNNLALLYFSKGDYLKAEPLFQRSLEIFEKANGRDHPFTARPLGNLASLYAAKGDFAQALLFQERYLAARERNLELNLYTGSERQKLAYVETLSRDLISTISLHTQSMPQSEEAKRMALRLILSRKGRTLDAMAGSVAALRRRALPEDQNLIDQLSDVRTRLATLTLRGAGNDNPEQYQQRLKTLEEKREKLEDEVSRRSLEFRAQSQSVTIDAVRAMIPENAALIEFITYRPVNPKAEPNEKSLSEPCYVAYVARKQGEVQWIKLGEAKTIDAAIEQLRQALRDPKRKDTQQLARLVDEKVMQPVRALAGGATHLLISPDGALNLIPFEALVDQQGKYLLERYSFTYLTSGRDLLRMQVGRASKSAPLVVADPLFGEPVLAQGAKAGAPQAKAVGLRRKRQSVTTSRDLSSVYFAPLGGTAGEARVIKSLFAEAEVLTGVQARESVIKQIDAPRILHIATHGFFLQDAVPAETAKEKKRSISASAKIENPLLRSGLALAGANLRGESGDDDGILTALEASGVNLWGTKLVTLSACDTGLGEVKNGEGVYGLRRAFVLAGAESLVMSLWPVSDWVTREMMSGYYKGLRQGVGRGQALRQVQLAMLKRQERQHPFYWASFIQSGEWANLEGKR